MGSIPLQSFSIFQCICILSPNPIIFVVVLPFFFDFPHGRLSLLMSVTPSFQIQVFFLISFQVSFLFSFQVSFSVSFQVSFQLQLQVSFQVSSQHYFRYSFRYFSLSFSFFVSFLTSFCLLPVIFSLTHQLSKSALSSSREPLVVDIIHLIFPEDLPEKNQAAGRCYQAAGRCYLRQIYSYSLESSKPYHGPKTGVLSVIMGFISFQWLLLPSSLGVDLPWT